MSLYRCKKSKQKGHQNISQNEMHPFPLFKNKRTNILLPHTWATYALEDWPNITLIHKNSSLHNGHLRMDQKRDLHRFTRVRHGNTRTWQYSVENIWLLMKIQTIVHSFLIFWSVMMITVFKILYALTIVIVMFKANIYSRYTPKSQRNELSNYSISFLFFCPKCVVQLVWQRRRRENYEEENVVKKTELLRRESCCEQCVI